MAAPALLDAREKATQLDASTALTYATIEAAMREKQPVRCRRGGESLCFCPHVLGLRDGHAHVLGYTLQLDPARPPAPGGWEWFRLADLDEVRATTGPWLTTSRWSLPSLGFLQQVDLQVG